MRDEGGWIMEKQNRRRNYFIKKKFQADFILKFCSLVVAGSILSGLIIYLMSKSTVTTVFENSRLTIKSTADFILPAVLLSSLVVIVVIGLATIVVTLFVSHRIAGPLYRMEKDVQEVASGNLKKRFKLRSTDELKLLAESLDGMAQNLRQDVDDIKSAASELEKEMPPEAKEKLARLKKSLDKFSL
jgi:methyl-accepting chemotaxis protein